MNEPTLIGQSVAQLADSLAHANDRAPRSRIGQRHPLDDHLRRLILRRDRYGCQWCTSTHLLQVDHIIPWSAGGLDIPTNLRALCKACNEKRSNHRTDMDWARGMQITASCLRCIDDLDPAAGNAFCALCSKVQPVSDYQLLLAEQHWARTALANAKGVA